MNIRLVSRDKALFRVCHEILSELPGRECRLTSVDPEAAVEQPGDLTLWDFDSATLIPNELDLEEERKHIFLVPRKHLSLLQKKLPLAALNILLKPVHRTTLRPFLEHALARSTARSAAGTTTTISSLRAERDEILQCFLKANLKLQEYDHDRTNFLARALHDFRAPLTAIKGYCGLLVAEELGPLGNDQKEVLLRMEHSLQRLSRMTTAMFELSVSREVEQRPNLQEGEIESCIEQAQHEIMPLADEKRISISVQVIPPPGPVLFERSQIEQVLINLLDNACKFTPQSGSIEVHGYPWFWDRRLINFPGPGPAGTVIDRRHNTIREPNAYRVDVRDSGPGIPVEHLAGIFEEYTSYTGGRDRSGVGLGLAICRLIIARHHGRVWAESDGQGAVFSFVLPLSRQETSFTFEMNAVAGVLPAHV